MTVQEYGPQTAHIEALIDRARYLTPREAEGLAAAWDAAGDAAAVRDPARDPAWAAARAAVRVAVRAAAWTLPGTLPGDPARDPAWAAARAAAGAAAQALIVRDLISTDHYDTLTRPWRTTIGRLHPNDPELTA